MSSPLNLVGVSRASLGHVRTWVAQGKLSTPLGALELQERGVEQETAQLLAGVLGELSRGPLLAVLDTLIIERDRAERERPRLLWTGPETPTSAALDTRVKLLELLREAQRSVLWAGYRFDDRSLLEPLHEAMCTRKVEATLVLEVTSNASDGLSRAQNIARALARFREVWAWTDVVPTLYIDPRSTGRVRDPEHPRGGYYVQMHAKTVVVDERWCIVGSANFTDAGTTRNIEAGVLLQSPGFAKTLIGQWRGLIAHGLLERVEAGAP